MTIELRKSDQGHFFTKKTFATPLGRACNIYLQYPKVIDAELKLNTKFPDGKFQIELLVPKTNKHMLRELFEVYKALVAAATASDGIWSKLSPAEIAQIKYPWMDADEDQASVKKNPHYAGMYRLHPKKRAGARIDTDLETGKKCPVYWEKAPKVFGPTQEPFSPRNIIPGHWCRAGVTLFTYNGAPEKVRNGDKIETIESRGVTMMLESVQYWKPGEVIVLTKGEPSDSASTFSNLPEGETAPPKPAPTPFSESPAAPADAGDGMPF